MLNDKMYVSRWGTQQIAGYCSTTFQEQQGFCFRVVTPYGYGGYGTQLRSMTACDVSNCLFASDQYTHYIYRADCQNNFTSSQWSVGSNPQGLSVTSSPNLLVALQAAHSLQEYSTNGELIRQIDLQPAGITNPVHAVQLSQSRYAVIHHGPKHQFSIVDSDGKLVGSYGDDAGNLNGPYGITVDKRGRVFVADQSNNRILVINPETLKAYPLPLPDCTLNNPYSMHYDAAKDHLYIGEWSGGRIVCCKLLKARL